MISTIRISLLYWWCQMFSYASPCTNQCTDQTLVNVSAERRIRAVSDHARGLQPCVCQRNKPMHSPNPCKCNRGAPDPGNKRPRTRATVVRVPIDDLHNKDSLIHDLHHQDSLNDDKHNEDSLIDGLHNKDPLIDDLRNKEFFIVLMMSTIRILLLVISTIRIPLLITTIRNSLSVVSTIRIPLSMISTIKISLLFMFLCLFLVQANAQPKPL